MSKAQVTKRDSQGRPVRTEQPLDLVARPEKAEQPKKGGKR